MKMRTKDGTQRIVETQSEDINEYIEVLDTLQTGDLILTTHYDVDHPRSEKYTSLLVYETHEDPIIYDRKESHPHDNVLVHGKEAVQYPERKTLSIDKDVRIFATDKMTTGLNPVMKNRFTSRFEATFDNIVNKEKAEALEELEQIFSSEEKSAQ